MVKLRALTFQFVIFVFLRPSDTGFFFVKHRWLKKIENALFFFPLLRHETKVRKIRKSTNKKTVA